MLTTQFLWKNIIILLCFFLLDSFNGREAIAEENSVGALNADSHESSDLEKSDETIPNFKWDDYKNHKDLGDALRARLPIGTDRKTVEQILLSQPGSISYGAQDAQEHIKKTGGYLAGSHDDALLYADPRFKDVKTFVRYNFKTKRPLIDFSSGTAGKITTVYYDSYDRLLNIRVYTTIVHRDKFD